MNGLNQVFEVSAREHYQRQSNGWNAIPWDKLEEDAKNWWRDFAARRDLSKLPVGVVMGEGEAYAIPIAKGTCRMVQGPMPNGKFLHAGKPNRHYRKSFKMARRFMRSVVNRYGSDLSAWPTTLFTEVAFATSVIANGKTLGVDQPRR